MSQTEDDRAAAGYAAERMSWAWRDPGYVPPKIDTSVPHPARIYNYLLGGRENYAPDRAAAERMVGVWPPLRTAMRQHRLFMQRAVRYLAAERGIDQFIDLGTGIPEQPNMHEIAQEIHPTARALYVDNDPIVYTYTEALMRSGPHGAIRCLRADLREPDTILDSPELHTTLDLDRPVAVIMLAVVYMLIDDQLAYDLVRHYLDRLPSGSALALSTVTADHKPPAAAGVAAEYNASGIPMRVRTRAQVSAFFDGLDLVEPGVVLVHRWRPDERCEGISDSEGGMYGAVAVKP